MAQDTKSLDRTPIGDVVRDHLRDLAVADGLNSLIGAVRLIEHGGLEGEDPAFRAVWESRHTLHRLAEVVADVRRERPS